MTKVRFVKSKMLSILLALQYMGAAAHPAWHGHSSLILNTCQVVEREEPEGEQPLQGTSCSFLHLEKIVAFLCWGNIAAGENKWRYKYTTVLQAAKVCPEQLCYVNGLWSGILFVLYPGCCFSRRKLIRKVLLDWRESVWVVLSLNY